MFGLIFTVGLGAIGGLTAGAAGNKIGSWFDSTRSGQNTSTIFSNLFGD